MIYDSPPLVYHDGREGTWKAMSTDLKALSMLMGVYMASFESETGALCSGWSGEYTGSGGEGVDRW